MNKKVKLIALISIVSVLGLLTVISGVMLLYRLTTTTNSPLAELAGTFASETTCTTIPRDGGCSCTINSQCRSNYCGGGVCQNTANCIAAARSCNTGGNCYCGASYAPGCNHNAQCQGSWCSSISCTLITTPNPTQAGGGSSPFPTGSNFGNDPTPSITASPSPTATPTEPIALPTIGSTEPIIQPTIPPVIVDSPEPTLEITPTVPLEVTQVPQATPESESGDAASGNVAIINAIGTFVVLLILTILGVIAVIIFAQAAFNEQENNS